MKNLIQITLGLSLAFLLSCGGTSPYTSASGGTVPPGTTNFLVTPNGMTSYTVNGGTNPSLSLTVGTSYSFTVNASGHPFFIMTQNSTDATNYRYDTGVTNNGIDSGTLTFTPTAAGTFYYHCSNHVTMGGVITVSN